MCVEGWGLSEDLYYVQCELHKKESVGIVGAIQNNRILGVATLDAMGEGDKQLCEGKLCEVEDCECTCGGW